LSLGQIRDEPAARSLRFMNMQVGGVETRGSRRLYLPTIGIAGLAA
jgi:hypothetical protein